MSHKIRLERYGQEKPDELSQFVSATAKKYGGTKGISDSLENGKPF